MKMNEDSNSLARIRAKALTVCLLGAVFAVSACGGDTKIRKTNCWNTGTTVTAVTPPGRA